jgi:hypothetical protein
VSEGVPSRIYQCLQPGCPNNGKVITVLAEIVGWVYFVATPMCLECHTEPRLIGWSNA